MPRASRDTASENVELDGLEVSPTEILAETMPVVLRNVKATEATL